MGCREPAVTDDERGMRVSNDEELPLEVGKLLAIGVVQSLNP